MFALATVFVMRDEKPTGRSTPWLSRHFTCRGNSRDYLAHRLDGARDLCLLALALGARPDGSALFGRMIREALIHFAAVIEELRRRLEPVGLVLPTGDLVRLKQSDFRRTQPRRSTVRVTPQQ